MKVEISVSENRSFQINIRATPEDFGYGFA
jgi:hypothetical protein